MPKFSKPTRFSERVRKLLMPIAEKNCPEAFDPEKLKYGFIARMGQDPNTGYVSVLYFYYCTDLSVGRYMVYDIGIDKPQNELRGTLKIVDGCSQCKYALVEV